MSDHVSIIVTPRDRHAPIRRTLPLLYERTSVPFDLVVVDAGSPAPVARRLREESARRGFRLVRSETFLPPTTARNLGLSQLADGDRFVVFLENDVEVSPGWLTDLLACARETGAWLVGPLLLEQLGRKTSVHMSGGWFEEHRVPGGGRYLADVHRDHHGDVERARQTSQERTPCDYLEYHCVLLSPEAVAHATPLDDAIRSGPEHLDLALTVRAAGGGIWVEPSANAVYRVPPPVQLRDLPTYFRRWSEAWIVPSVQHFYDKWGLARTQEFYDRIHGYRGFRYVFFRPLIRLGQRPGWRALVRAVVAPLMWLERSTNRALFGRSAS